MDFTQVILSCSNFESNYCKEFQELREEGELFDVTLACKEGQLEAHRVILSSSSTFFMTILKKNPHPKPVIFMRGISIAQLVAMVDFLYFGEAKVHQENLEDFLALAQDLGLEGLVGENENSEEGEVVAKELSTIEERELGLKEEISGSGQ